MPTGDIYRRDSPQFYVEVEGDSGSARLLVADPQGTGDPMPDGAARLLSFEYTDSERRADSLKLTVDNFDLVHFDDPVWKKGNGIVARWGYAGRMTPSRRLVVTKVTGGVVLTIEARAESVLLDRVTRSRLFERMRISDIVRQVASENGFGPDAQDIEDTEVVFETLNQARLTDAQFIRRLANREGFEFYVDFDGLHFHRRRVEQRPVRRYVYYTDPNMGEVLSFNVENDITARPGRVRQRSRDPIEGETREAVADTSNSAFAELRQALTQIVEVIDGDTGAGRFETRTAQETTEPTSETNQQAIERETQARQRRHQQTAVKMTMECVGDPFQYAKTVVQLEGMGRRLSVRYWVKEVVHKLGGRAGYTMTLKLISDGHGGHSTVSHAARGIELLQPGPQNRARVNDQEAPEQTEGDEPRELRQVETVDGDTGRTRIIYVDAQGREVRPRSDVIINPEDVGL